MEGTLKAGIVKNFVHSYPASSHFRPLPWLQALLPGLFGLWWLWFPGSVSGEAAGYLAAQDVSATAVPEQTVPPEVAHAELQSAGPVEFTSYVGPHAVVDSLADIIAIGTHLAGLDDEGGSDYAGKYTVQHIPGEQPELFGADILSLGASAGVDHIRNLRHIISGYLQARYDYEAEAADTISVFTTYYNAYYRQNAAYFQQRFSLAVNAALQPESIGLSTNYSDWPGATQLIIPLSSNPLLNQQSGPNLDETGKKAVSEYLREEDSGKAMELRQDMLGLRQEQLSNDQQALEEKQGDLQEQNRELQKQLDTTRARTAVTDDLAERENNLEREQELKEQLQNNRKSQNDLGATQNTIAQRQDNLGKEQRELNREQQQQENNAAEEQEEQEEQKDSAESSVAVTDEDRADEDAGQEEERALPVGTKVVLLPFKNNFYRFYGIAQLEIVRRSEVNSVRSLQLVANDSGYIVVAGEHDITNSPETKQGSSAEVRLSSRRIRLLKLKKNLDYEMQGPDDIHPDSGVWEAQDQLFAFLRDGTMGRFNQELELLSRSDEILRPATGLQFIDDYVLVETVNGAFVLLDRITLHRKKELKP